ncbi:MAG: hypothetical protein WAW39_16660 [Prosthecobacter sp.]|uniref:hypothetical protein n=1 Tax=Prosthecobacter sp. TaxID=1965333 RepID=UPI003BB0881D
MTLISSLPMQVALQVFARREVARAEPEVASSYRNFLIVAPGSVGAGTVPDEKVLELAQHLNQEGYAYVARSNQKEMEDDPSGVRYLPLSHRLPAFGVMTAVIVIGDPLWAALAAATYPEADIFLM